MKSRKPFRVGRSRTGLGLFATAPIRKGAFIIEYTGKLLPNKIADELDNRYLFEINSRWTLDGSTRRNTARYINHSCRPNAESDVIRHKVIIRAIKNIQEGDEITYDYGKDYFGTFLKPIGCRCAKCVEKRKQERAEARAAAKRRKARRLRAEAKAKAAARAARAANGSKTSNAQKTANAQKAANGHKAGTNGHKASNGRKASNGHAVPTARPRAAHGAALARRNAAARERRPAL